MGNQNNMVEEVSNAREGFACPNELCGCPHCTCGEKCTCGVSKEVNCDPCAEFSKAPVDKTDMIETKED